MSRRFPLSDRQARASSTLAGFAQVRAEVEGLDQLQLSGLKKKRQSVGVRIVLPVLAVCLFLVIWQLYVVLTGERADVIPGPLDVLKVFGQLWDQGSLQEAATTSLKRGVLGFLLSIVIGTSVGLLLAQVKGLRIAFGPLVSGLQVLPSVAWVPPAIIWFGLSDSTIYFVLLMGGIPSIINGLISGVDQIPPDYLSVGKVLGAGRFDQALRVVLPAALPGYITGLRQGWAFSWRSLMAAEIIAIGGTMGFGLGSLLQRGRDLSDMAEVMVAILVILFLGIAIEIAIFAPLERRLLRSRGLQG